MRSGLVISKRRIEDWCIAKGDDNRTIIDDTDPLNPITIYPIFQFRLNAIDGLTTNSGVLDVRPTIMRSGEIMKTRIQRFSGALSGYVGDNTSRSSYPTGLLELHLRVPRWQLDKLSQVNFRYGGFGSSQNAQYFTSYIDVSKLRNVKGIRTVDNSNANNRISYLNLGVNPNMERLLLYSISTTSIDISNMPLLRQVVLGIYYNNLNSITTGGTYNNLTVFESPGGNLTTIPDLDSNSLVSLDLSNNLIVGGVSFNSVSYKTTLRTLNISNNPLGSSGVNISALTNLRFLNLDKCNLNSLDLSNNLDLRELTLGVSNSSSSTNNNFSSGGLTLQDLYVLSNLELLRALRVSLLNVSGQPLDFSYFPNIKHFEIGVNTSGTFINLESNTLTSLSLRELSLSGTIDGTKVPNLTTLAINGTGNINVVNWTGLTKLNTLSYYSVTNPNNKIVDLSGLNQNLSSNTQFRGNTYLEELILPNYQVNSSGTLEISGNNVLNSIGNINTIARNNSSVYIIDNNLSILNTSRSSASCFNSCTSLALGGSNDSYTSTAVYDFRKNNVSTLHIRGSVFQTSGSIGTDTCANATFIDIEGDADLSFTTIGGFGATMRRVFIRPKTGSGLATDGNQIANLIIYLSSKTWTTSTTPVGIGGTSYTLKVIDLRGNCATPTPSTSLTDALDLLTTKGVTVLTN